ncbi:TPR repeat-containing protein [Tolypothrix sp. NIES-4075]|uniref:tetratricopeptide repeat protein n=1 Tax=Tolypothrix sp. NIES-4075 TaxID=2005459 RepID=UPI000B5D0650|nr:tetratricopeptide repeat protein [Tolypothrix sp. NIES-4075]GAX40431.1 TPR repeat-containing protein [Tolypothrix sp. NIES-4075]
MDWITLLRSLQSDFIKRLSSGCLLHCQTEGQYSELTIISGERLKALRDFCWLMAEKYKRTSPVRDVFINNLKGKLGEEVVKERLADFITEVDYEKRFGGDGNIDFTLSCDRAIGIEVKSRHGSIDRVRWSVSSEEVEKNAVVVCILIQEEVNEAQPEYHLFVAGFLPTQMIKLKTGRISFGIEQLLYGGGLFGYLEQLQSAENHHFSKQQKNQFRHYIYSENLTPLHVKQGDECFEKREYEAAIDNYNAALKLNPHDAEIYYKRGLARYYLVDDEKAIQDYNQAIKINPKYAKAYSKLGLARYELGDYEQAIADYTQAIEINPYDAVAYRNRADARFHIGDNQGAIEDYNQAIKINPDYGRYEQRVIDIFNQSREISFHDEVAGNGCSELEDLTQAIKINPNDADAYYNRGNARFDLGDRAGAIEDYTQAIKINYNYADAYYNRGNARSDLGDKLLAIEDFQKATDLYWKEGKLAEHKDARERILELEIEESLDILNF